MKRALGWLLLMLFLAGCSYSQPLEQEVPLRSQQDLAMEAEQTEKVERTAADDSAPAEKAEEAPEPVIEPEAAAHAALMERVMADAGFRPYSGEWWHFSDTDAYDMETVFVPAE